MPSVAMTALLDEAREVIARKERRHGLEWLTHELESLREMLIESKYSAFHGRALAFAVALSERLMELSNVKKPRVLSQNPKRIRERAYRKRRKEAGICRECGGDADDGSYCCRVCRIKKNERRKEAKRKARAGARR